jgi:hypothetical protein
MRMLARVACVVTAAVAAGSAAPAAQSRSPLPTVPQLLAAAAKYVAEYDKKFSAVVSEEKYEQVVTQSTGFRAQQRRTLVSDVILINAGDAGWISLRDVYQVDGSPVRDHTDRLLKLLTNPAPDAYQQALRLAQEGARFNIGSMSRSINVPSTALRFVRQENQRHSSFSVAGMKTIDGVNTAELAFTETATPRLIRSPADAPADGKVWLEPASGAHRSDRAVLEVREELVREDHGPLWRRRQDRHVGARANGRGVHSGPGPGRLGPGRLPQFSDVQRGRQHDHQVSSPGAHGR